MAAETEALLQQMQTQIAQLQIDLAASAAATTAATDAAATATATLAGLPPTGATNLASTAPTFALSPAVANAGAFLDLSSSKGAKLFKLGSKPLPRSFDFQDPSDIQVFLDLLKAKAKVQGWGRIFRVPVDIDGVVTNYSLLLDYEVIPLASVTLDAINYVNSETKSTQDSFMLFQCIFGSLDTSFLKVVTTESDNYHVADTKVPTDPPIPCGALLLKITIMKAHVDTRATIGVIRTSLSSLDTRMMTLDSDISKFNAFVKTQVISLQACGESVIDSELLMNVFKGYESAQDADFALYIKRKRDSYDEGDDINIVSFMDAAENKYKTRVLKQLWSAPTKEQEQILALTARADKADAFNKQLRSGTPKKDKRTPSKDKAKLDKEKKWAWKKIHPKEGEPVTKTVDGKSCHLECAHHPDQWVCHTPEECSKNPANIGTVGMPGKQRLKEARIAAAAIIDPDDDVESDGDSY
jgi:hypothetical protein